jgi:hypothetical protein
MPKAKTVKAKAKTTTKKKVSKVKPNPWSGEVIAANIQKNADQISKNITANAERIGANIKALMDR